MNSDKPIEVVVKVRIKKEKVFWAGGLMTLLELVESQHSLKKACEKMQMSYSKGHKIIKNAEKELGHPLITSKKGGAQGGGSSLSKEGIIFMKCYKECTKEMQKLGEKVFQECFQEYL